MRSSLIAKLGALVLLSSAAQCLAQTNLGVHVRHAPSFNGPGRIEGSAQQFLGEGAIFNSGFVLTGDFYVPGSPSIVTNGSPSWLGVMAGGGSTSPSGYQIILNGGVSLRYLRTRTTPGTLPTVIAPPTPNGTRSVTISSAGQSIGDPSTLRNLTLNGSVGQIYVPPGTYGNFIANSASGFTLGIANTTTVYNLQSLTLNGSTKFLLNGPVILTVANGFTANGIMGTTNHSSWLQLNLSSGGLTLNSGCTLHGRVVAPAGTVVINGSSILIGTIASDRLTINSNGKIIVGGDAAMNQPPVANAQSVSLDEDTDKAITLTGNDPESATLTYLVVSGPARGSITGTPPNLVYRPNTNATGADAFTFKVNDGAQDSALATVSISITPLNDAPAALAQSLSTAEDTIAPITLSGTDVEGGSLTYSIVSEPQHGFLEGTPPNLTYVPSNNFNGADSFTFKVNDGQLDSAAASVSINVLPVDDRPVADAQTVVTDEDAAKEIVLTGEDPEFDSLTYTIVSQPAHGALSGTPPNLTYLPATNYFGSDAFSFKVSDGELESAPTNVVINVLPVNDSPVANAASFTLSEDTATNLVLTASDVDGTNFQYIIISEPSHGTLTLLNDTATYSPAANYFGSDSFTFAVSDGSITSAVALVTLSIAAINDAPVADAKAIVTDEDTAAAITLTGNDVETSALSFQILTLPAHGVLSGLPPNLSYAPEPNYFGVDSFTYVANDGTTNSAPAVVNVAINAINDAPVALAASYSTDENVPKAITLLGNDVESATLLFQVVTAPVHGTLSGTPPNVIYTPHTNYHGNDSFTFNVNDGELASPAAAVSISVLPGNHAPTVSAGQNQLVVLPTNVALRGTVADDGLPVNSTVTVRWSRLMGPTTVSFDNVAITNPTVTFSAPGNYILRLTADDGALTNYADVTFVVKNEAMNEAPVVNAGNDKTVGLTNSLVLEAFASDDGLPRASTLAIQWSKVSGPGDVAFANPGAATTRATFSQVGSYVLQLVANDSLLSATDQVAVVVHPFNQPPVVDAGPDQSIAIPDPAVLAAGSSNAVLNRHVFSGKSWDTTISHPGLQLLHNQITAPSPFIDRAGMAASGTNLYVSGHFYGAGGLRVWTLARWDGAEWHAVRDANPQEQPGVGIWGYVPNESTGIALQLAARGDELFVLGSRLRDFNADGYLDSSARFTGSNWVQWGPQRAEFGGMRAVAVTPAAAYYGAYMDFQATNQIAGCATCGYLPDLPISHGIAKWDGTNWSFLGDGIVGHIAAILPGTNDELYVAGGFMSDTANGIAYNIAKWTGTRWERLGAGLKGYVDSSHAFGAQVFALAWGPDGALYAGGAFSNAGGLTANRIAKWDGTNWSAIGVGAQNGVNGSVNAIVFDGEDMYVGGNFTSAGGFPANSIARFRGQFWSPLGLGPTNGVVGIGRFGVGDVNALAMTPDGLYVGGQFITGSTDATNIVLWESIAPPANGVVLNGHVTDDGLPQGSLVSASWTKISGPGQALFANSNSASTIVTFDQIGTYVLRLVANDSELTSFDELTIEVRGNTPPVPNAGEDFVLRADEMGLLSGTVNDDGLPTGTDPLAFWSVFSSPEGGAVLFGNAGKTNTSVVFDTPGTYVLRLAASDSQFDASDDVTVTVLDRNAAPSVSTYVDYAFPWDERIILPADAVIHGLVSDDQLPSNTLSFAWSVVSGPARVTFADATAVDTTARFLLPGTYVLRFSANDSQLSAFVDVQVIVVEGTLPDLPPFVYAGADRTVTMLDSLILNGVLIDEHPESFGFSWFGSGPGFADFIPYDATNTVATFDTPGRYEVYFQANEGWNSYWDTLIVNVLPAAGANLPPTAYAGPNRAVLTTDLPLQLRGEASDDGLPAPPNLQVQWSLTFGHGVVTFSDSNSVSSTVTFSNPGYYELLLTATDGELTISSRVEIYVVDPSHGNTPPIVSAGSDQTITLPQGAMLAGTATDDNVPGYDLTYRWSQVSGPGFVTFVDRFALSTVAVFSKPGDYVINFSASDSLQFNSDNVTIHVLPRTNQPPIVYAGVPQNIFLPTNTTSLAAAVQDDAATGTLTYSWSVQSAPDTVSFADDTALATDATFANAEQHVGVPYVLRLTVNDGEFESSAYVSVTFFDPAYYNTPPVVDAGPDQSVPVGTSYEFQGSVVDDNNPYGFVFTSWSQVSGPTTAFIFDNGSLNASLSLQATGVYVFRLTADDFEFSGADDITITALPSLNERPIVLAGPATTVSLQNLPLTLQGFASDDGKPTGSSLVTTWRLAYAYDGGDATFGDSNSLTSTVSFDQVGRYALELSATDGEFTQTSILDVYVIDETDVNYPPIVFAGTNLDATVGEPIALGGVVTDDGRTELPWVSWDVASGPTFPSFADSSSTNTTVTFTAPGVYRLVLSAWDGMFEESDDIVVTVTGGNAINTAPLVHAGFPQRFLIENGTAVTGAAYDDGLPLNVLTALWSKASGPGDVTFGNATQLVTTATFSAPGNYTLRLTAFDGELSGNAEVSMTVVGADTNQPPIVNAGPDRSAFVATDFALNGSASDDAAQPSVSWSQISGPSAVYFGNANSAQTAARIYAAGTYVLRLTANDGHLSAFDDMTITVIAPTNEPPIAVAGPNLLVVRPHAAELSGVVFDDGLPVGYPLVSTWSKISGPGMVTFTPNSNAPEAEATFSAAGTYVLRLTGDDSQFTDFDEITVTVLNGTNEPPVIAVASNMVANLGTPIALQSTVTDDGLPNGTLQVTWAKVSGPGAVAFSTLNGIYRASFNAPGDHVIRIIADDSELRATNDLAVTVVDAPNAPTVAIVSPIDTAIITAPTIVTGLVQSAVLESWSLRYRLKPADSQPETQNSELETWTTLASGAAEIVNAPLATFDPTLLLNGIYELKLTATDTLGRSSETDPITVIVDRNMKVGNFTLSFNDLTIPVAGIPIQVIRTYDSRDKRAGDFGVGWTLQLKDVRLQKNRHLGKAWDHNTTGGLFPVYFIDTVKPRVVTITFPDNKVYKFGATLSPSSQFGVPLIYPRMTYVPLENTRGNLTPVWFEWRTGEGLVDDQLVFAGEVPGRADFLSWELLLDPPPGPADNILYNPDLFEFTTPEGYTYSISETNGLRSITDPNTNTLVITTNGLTWTNAAGASSLSVLFQRDELGRITNIVDAMGQAMSYRYDTNGNLVTFTDREGSTNGFSYSAQHQLLVIADPRGIKAVRNEYDECGRLIRHIDANGKHITYAHDIDHRLEIITNRLGFVTISEYDERGNVVKVTDAIGATTTSAYDANDNLVMTIDPLGRTNSFTYDTQDNRTSVTDALGHTTHVTYNDMRRITSATDARGNTTTNVYDRNGRLLWVRDPAGGITSFTYDARGLPAAMTNALGAVSLSQYDEHGWLTNRTDALGHSSQFVYDSAGRVLSTATTRVTSSGTERLEMLKYYDGLGRLTNAVFPDGTQQHTVFDERGHVARLVDQLGRVTRFEYDDQGRSTRVIYPDGISETAGYDAEGRVTSRTNRMGFATRYDYDAVGRVVRTENPDGSSSTNYYDTRGQVFATCDALGRTAFFGYDALGRVAATTNALGHVNRSFFDAAGNLAATLDPASRITQFFYDSLNRRTNTVFADGTQQTTFFDVMGRRSAELDASGRITSFGYDDLGRLTSITNALGQVTRTEYNELGQVVAQIDALNRRMAFEHDALGRVVRTIFADSTAQQTFYDELGRRMAQTDAATNTTRFGYDIVGRLVAITNALGYVTRYEYDDLGRQTAQIDANNHRTIFGYDALGRRTTRTLPGGEMERYFYDLVGNLTNRTDFNGYGATFVQDELNRLIAKIPDRRRAEPAVAFSYNELGLRTNMVDASGITTYRYDNRNRLIEKVTPQGTLFYSYDAVGSVTNIRSSNLNGANLSYAYDELHRIQEVTDPYAGRTPYTYDAVGNLRSFTHANGVLNYFEYDSLNRLTNLSSSTGLTTIANYRYTVNAFGFRVSATDTLSGGILGNLGTTISRAYRYDPLYRLTNETILAGSQNSSLDYSYDAVGNRLSLNSTLWVIPSVAYSYTPNDRLTSDSYDDNGNTIGANLRDPFSGISYGVTDSYDFENRLIRRVEDGRTINIVYDGDGNRVKKTITTATNIVTTWFLVDTVNPSGYAQVLEEITFKSDDPHFAQPAVSHIYTYGHALLSQQQFVSGGWQLSFYGQDGHSSVRYLTDNNGFVTDTYDFDAFGNLIARGGTRPNSYLFTSEQYDSDLSLYYLRARYHNPQSGRFWTMDSLEGFGSDPMSLHKYAYCGNNPVNHFDPSGNTYLTASVYTVALGLVARTTLYSTLGFITGTIGGGIRCNLERTSTRRGNRCLYACRRN